MSFKTRTEKMAKSIPAIHCPTCGSVNVSYASIQQTSLTCHECGFTNIKTTMIAGGNDPAAELLKVLATGAIIAIGFVAAVSILDALFGPGKSNG
jgi:ribosomal protein S27E